MNKKRSKGRVVLLFAVLWLFCLSGYAVAAGLYFRDPMVGGGSYRALEEGANAYVDIYYDNTAGYSQMNSAVMHFYYSNAIIENISVSNLCDLNMPEPIIESNRVKVDLLPQDNNPIPILSDQPLVRVSFHVIQAGDANAGSPLGIQWVGTALETNVVTEVGQVNDFENTLSGVTIHGKFSPDFSGIGSVTDPQTGNTLNIAWPAESRSIDDPDNDTQTPAAATYYGGGGLKFKVYRDGALAIALETVGKSSWINERLNDMQEYTFNVEAIDACSPDPNESDSQKTLKGTPHDYTEPGCTMTKPSPADSQLTISWGGGSDLGGYIVYYAETDIGGSAPGIPIIPGAHDNENGTPPDQAKTTITGVGWTLLIDDSTSPTNYIHKGLDNAKQYHYVTYAYDKIGGSPVNQGYNWSSDSTTGVPGKKPHEVTNFLPLSNIANGVSFTWNVSDIPNYAGAKIVYTTNYDEWASLSPEATAALELDVDDPIVDPPTVSLGDKINPAVEFTGLDRELIYYFAIYAYNSSKLLWSGPVYGAAVPGGLGGTGGSLTFDLKVEGGYGINSISIPFEINDNLKAASGEIINSIQKLVMEINAAANSGAGANIVETITYYNSVTQVPHGVAVVYNSTGLNDFSDVTKNIDFVNVGPLQRGSYIISINQPSTFTIIGDL